MSRHRAVRALALFLVSAVVFAIGCDSSRDASKSVQVSTPLAIVRTIEAPRDLPSVMKRVHFGFRDDGSGALIGGHSTYASRIEGGALALTVRGEVHSPFRVETVAAGRSVPIDVRSRNVHASALDGRALVDRGSVIEEIKNDAAGVEESWTFAAPPSGNGPLCVSESIAGSTYEGKTRGGEHFRDPTSGARVRISPAYWIDANGSRTRLASAYAADPSQSSNGVLTFCAPASLVDNSVYPARIDPTIGPEISFDQPVDGPAPFAQAYPSMASNGSTILVVWQDSRSGVREGTADADGYEYLYDIYGARIDAATGLVFPEDVQGVPINTSIGDQIFPVAAFANGEFFVVWMDGRDGTTYDLYGAHVDPSTGHVLAADVNGIPLVTSATNQEDPCIATDGTQYLIGWWEPDTYQMRRARFSTAGVVNPEDKDGILISDPLENSFGAPAVAFDGTNFVFAISQSHFDAYHIFATLIDPATGAVTPANAPLLQVSPFVPGNGDSFDPSISCTSANCLVTWDDHPGDFDVRSNVGQISAVRISTAQGNVTPLDTAVLPLTTNAVDYAYGPYLDNDGTNYFVAWTTFPGGLEGGYDTNGTLGGIYGSVVEGATGALVPGTPQGLTIAQGASQQNIYAEVIRADSDFLLVWNVGITTNFNPNGADLVSARVSPSTGAFVDSPNTRLLIQSPNVETTIATAFNGSTYLAVWQDTRAGGSYDLYGARMDATTGDVFTSDAMGIPIATAGGDQISPAAIANGSDFLVVWQDFRDGQNYEIYGSRVSGTLTSGATLDPNGVAIAIRNGDEERPAIAPLGTSFLVAWADGTGQPYTAAIGDYSHDLYGAFVTTTGSGLIASSPLSLVVAPDDQTLPSLASNAAKTGVLLAWDDRRNGSSYAIYATTLSANGQAATTGTAVGSTSFPERASSVAYAGSNYLVVWEDFRPDPIQADIYGRELDQNGKLIGVTDFPLSIAPGSQVSPRVVSVGDGLNYQVVWSDGRNVGTSQDTGMDVYGSLVSLEGMVREPDGLALSRDPGDEIGPSLSTGLPGNMVVAYSAIDEALGVARARARLFNAGQAIGTTCTSSDECATRFCADGYCCDAECNGACLTCKATPGTCTSVTNAQDPDTCNDPSICDGTGACKLKDAQGCASGADCTSGNCVAGYCCDTACTGACEVCSATPGTCTIVPIGNPGNPSCHPDACDGVSATCPGACTGDSDCARGFYCANGSCRNSCASDSDCPSGNFCDTNSGQCAATTTCDGDHSVKNAATGVVTDCTPFACQGNACLQTCASVTGCASGFICSAAGLCVAQPSSTPVSSSGCSCRIVAASSSPTSRAAFAFAVLAGCLARTRRRRRSCAIKRR
jgi:hypothetical protein